MTLTSSLCLCQRVMYHIWNSGYTIVKKDNAEWLTVMLSFVDSLSVFCDNIVDYMCLIKIRLYDLVLFKLVENGQMVVIYSWKETAI